MVFDNGKYTYKSDIKLGERYRDKVTGFEGRATSIYFFENACERIQVERVNPIDGKIEELVFDAVRLIHADSGAQATSKRPGGPAREHHMRPGEPG